MGSWNQWLKSHVQSELYLSYFKSVILATSRENLTTDKMKTQNRLVIDFLVGSKRVGCLADCKGGERDVAAGREGVLGFACHSEPSSA